MLVNTRCIKKATLVGRQIDLEVVSDSARFSCGTMAKLEISIFWQADMIQSTLTKNSISVSGVDEGDTIHRLGLVVNFVGNCQVPRWTGDEQFVHATSWMWQFTADTSQCFNKKEIGHTLLRTHDCNNVCGEYGYGCVGNYCGTTNRTLFSGHANTVPSSGAAIQSSWYGKRNLIVKLEVDNREGCLGNRPQILSLVIRPTQGEREGYITAMCGRNVLADPRSVYNEPPRQTIGVPIESESVKRIVESILNRFR